MFYPGFAFGIAKQTFSSSSAQQDALTGSTAPALCPTMILPHPQPSTVSHSWPRQGQIHHLSISVKQALTGNTQGTHFSITHLAVMRSSSQCIRTCSMPL